MLLLAAAFVASLITEALITVFTSFVPSEGDYYGAPLPVGISCFDLPLSRCPTTFSGALFAVNVLLTGIGWFILARWSGIVGVIAAVIGWGFGIGAIVVMLGYGLPVVGFPIPVLPKTPLPNTVAIWLDAVFWAVAASALARVIRRKPPTRQANSVLR